MLGIKSHKLFPTLFLEGCSDSEGNGLEISRGVWSGWSVGQGGGHFALQVVSGDSDHPEVRFSAVCSGNSHPPPSPPCAMVLALALSICFFQGQLLVWKPTSDLSPQPQVSKETVFVVSLNSLGKVVPMLQAFQNLGLRSFSLGVMMQPALENSEQ